MCRLLDGRGGMVDISEGMRWVAQLMSTTEMKIGGTAAITSKHHKQELRDGCPTELPGRDRAKALRNLK